MGPVRRTYKGYTFADMTTEDDVGHFKARAAIMSLDGSRTRFQRFLDLETFKTRDEASARVQVAAVAWIESDIGRDRLALPTNFGVFD